MADNRQHIRFIGAGNMARSIIAGMDFSRYRVSIADPNAKATAALCDMHPELELSDGNTQHLAQVDALVLAIKPQIMQAVCEEIAPALGNNNVIISIAAGVSMSSIRQWLATDSSRAMVRCMPNLPAQIGQGMSGLYADDNLEPMQKEMAEAIFNGVGQTLWLNNETEINALTAISGSGPAYFFLFIEAMNEAAEALGFTPDTAKKMVMQTALGAVNLAHQSEYDAAVLRQQVTSKGGTTEAALDSFDADHFKATVKRAALSAHRRALSLAEQQD